VPEIKSIVLVSKETSYLVSSVMSIMPSIFNFTEQFLSKNITEYKQNVTMPVLFEIGLYDTGNNKVLELQKEITKDGKFTFKVPDNLKCGDYFIKATASIEGVENGGN
jgi:hypothetical protein